MPTASRKAGSGERLAGVDAGRTVAAAGVVFTHWIATSEAVWLRPIGLIGVPFFISAAVLLTVRQSFTGRRSVGMVMVRARRVLVPYVVWSCIYFVLTYGISGWLLGGRVPRPPATDYIDGFGGHLWFLPLVFLIGAATIGASVIARASVVGSGVVVAVSIASGAALVVLTEPDPGNLARWPYELPVACFVLACAVSQERGWVRVPRSVWLGLVGCAAVVGLVVWQIRFGEIPARRACQAAGVLMLLAGVAMPSRWVPTWFAGLGRLSYGVYISHTVVILVLHRALGGRGELSTAALLGLYPLVVSGAFVFAWMLKRAPGFRRLMP